MATNKPCPDCREILSNPKYCAGCGWRDSTRKEAGVIEPWPNDCMVDRCMNKTAVAHAVMENNGNQQKVAAGTGLYPNTKGYSERSGWKFVKWITRCCSCYLRELDVMKRSRFLDAQTEARQRREALENEPKTKAATGTAYDEAKLIEQAKQQQAAMELSWMNSDPSGLSHWRSVAETGRPEADLVP